MPSDLNAILKLEVPVIVLLGQRQHTLSEITALAPGAIIELPKGADDELELLVNNKVVGLGRAVKVGENFGVRLTFVGDIKSRVQAMGAAEPAAAPTEPAANDAEALAEQMLAGQMGQAA
jgi:flagellar motor switch protein FliN/FliY